MLDWNTIISSCFPCLQDYQQCRSVSVQWAEQRDVGPYTSRLQDIRSLRLCHVRLGSPGCLRLAQRRVRHWLEDCHEDHPQQLRVPGRDGGDPGEDPRGPVPVGEGGLDGERENRQAWCQHFWWGIFSSSIRRNQTSQDTVPWWPVNTVEILRPSTQKTSSGWIQILDRAQPRESLDDCWRCKTNRKDGAAETITTSARWSDKKLLEGEILVWCEEKPNPL